MSQGVNKSSFHVDPPPAPTCPASLLSIPGVPTGSRVYPNDLSHPLVSSPSRPPRKGQSHHSELERHSAALHVSQPECHDLSSLLDSLQLTWASPRAGPPHSGASQGPLQVGTLPSAENSNTLWSASPQTERGSIVLRLENDRSATSTRILLLPRD